MPEIQDINDFKNDILRLGNEPEIREQRGESLPNITVPESQSVGDLSELFGDTADDLEGFDGSELFGGEEPAEEEFSDEVPAEGRSSDEDISPDTEDSAFEDDFNLPAGLTEGLSDELSEDENADEDIFGGFDDLGDFEEAEVEEAEDVAEEIAEVAEPAEEAEAPDDGEFSLDDFNLEEFAEEAEEPEAVEDFEEVEELEDFEEVEPVETETAVEDAESVEDFDFGDIGDFEESSEEPADFETDFETESLEFSDEEETAPPAPAEESSEADMFDTSELDDAGFGEFESDMSEFETDSSSGDLGTVDEEAFSLEDFSLGEIDGDDIDAAEFSLGDLGEEFGIDDEDEAQIGQLEDIETEGIELGAEESFGDAYADDSYAIPDDEYIELKKTLGRLPRNLKLQIEELIGEKHLSGENLDKLVQVLIKGASAREIGAVVSKITGKKIRIPAQYERRSAEEFEKEKSTFGYAFRKNFLPMFRTAALAAVALGLLLFLGYRFVYTPLHAESLYRKGYEEIPQGNNTEANAYFDQAFNEWRNKNWFYKYAESFTEQKQYSLAEEKYENLLGWYPDEREAVLDYAELEYKILGKYPEAEKLLNDFLFDELRDYDARLMLADTYMEWAREIDSSKYEDARFNYAKLLEQYGSRDQLLFRMLRYFIRTDNYTEATKLYEAFRQNDNANVEPEIYAELAGYLIDHDHLEDVREILMKARSIEEEIPEIHYELGRYFDIIDIPIEEAKALSAAIWLFENTNPLTRTRTGMLIDSYNRYGQVLYEQMNYLDAENYFSKAAMNYEESLASGLLKPDSKYGNIYSNLGDLAYYISGDYDQALKYYENAELNMYSPPVLKYKKGYIHYSDEEYREALIEFYDTAGGFSIDKGLMYSTANTLFNRNDYFLAEGTYTHLLDILEKEYSSINYLLIDEIPEHRILLENIMKVSNNLGVTKFRLYERTRDPKKNSEAMVLLTDSVEYYDKLSRDPDSLVEPETVNLSYLNSRAVFYPVQDYRLQIYQDIPKDLDMPAF